jgi:hypothetical protein
VPKLDVQAARSARRSREDRERDRNLFARALFQVCMLALGSLALLLPSLLVAPHRGDFVRALTVIACGDVNHDGTADLALGLPRDDGHGTDAGRVFIVSGKDGATLRELHVGSGTLGFGFALAGGVDFDGDGALDLAVSSHRDGFDGIQGSDSPARIHIFDVTSGALRHTLEEPPAGKHPWAFASALQPIGDWDGDGGVDLWVESRVEAESNGGWRSPAYVVSGKTARVLQQVSFDERERPVLLGDLDADGLRDLGRIRRSKCEWAPFSAKGPLTYLQLPTNAPSPRALVDLGDLDRDGRAELAVLGKLQPSAHCEDALVLSVREGAQPYELKGSRLRIAAGVDALAGASKLALCGAPDLDGDGCGEVFALLAGATRSTTLAERAQRHRGGERRPGTFLQGSGALVSSKTGDYLWTTFGTEEEPLGLTLFDDDSNQDVRRVPDFDGDGRDDIAVAACTATTSQPYEQVGANVRILSSRDGAWILSIEAHPGHEPRSRLFRATDKPRSPK